MAHDSFSIVVTQKETPTTGSRAGYAALIALALGACAQEASSGQAGTVGEDGKGDQGGSTVPQATASEACVSEVNRLVGSVDALGAGTSSDVELISRDPATGVERFDILVPTGGGDAKVLSVEALPTLAWKKNCEILAIDDTSLWESATATMDSPATVDCDMAVRDLVRALEPGNQVMLKSIRTIDAHSDSEYIQVNYHAAKRVSGMLAGPSVYKGVTVSAESLGGVGCEIHGFRATGEYEVESSCVSEVSDAYHCFGVPEDCDDFEVARRGRICCESGEGFGQAACDLFALEPLRPDYCSLPLDEAVTMSRARFAVEYEYQGSIFGDASSLEIQRVAAALTAGGYSLSDMTLEDIIGTLVDDQQVFKAVVDNYPLAAGGATNLVTVQVRQAGEARGAIFAGDSATPVASIIGEETTCLDATSELCGNLRALRQTLELEGDVFDIYTAADKFDREQLAAIEEVTGYSLGQLIAASEAERFTYTVAPSYEWFVTYPDGVAQGVIFGAETPIAIATIRDGVVDCAQTTFE